MVKNKIPKIISTGGLNLFEIDKIVRLMKKYNQTFLDALYSIYPSEDFDLQISFIKSLKDIQHPIGGLHMKIQRIFYHLHLQRLVVLKFLRDMLGSTQRDIN